MEEVVRRVLVKYFEFCKSELATNPSATGEELEVNVMVAIATNELPQ